MSREEISKVVMFLCFYLFTLSLFHNCAAISILTSSRPVLQGQTLTSEDQVFELGFFCPDHSLNYYVGIWYKNILPRSVVWVANRGKAVMNSPASLQIGRYGNLMLVDVKQDIIWSTNIIAPSNGSVAVLLNNGNFILKDRISGENLWQSGDHPSDTFLPGTWTVSDVKTGKRGALISWKSDIDPSPGSFAASFTQESPPQAFIWKGLTPYWRGGPWDKSEFIGISGSGETYQSVFMLLDDTAQGTASVSLRTIGGCNFSNLGISSAGYLKFMCFVVGKGWYSTWHVPENGCDIYGVCGPFGVCERSEPLTCGCLKGFEPKKPDEWSKGNWTAGCTRRKQLMTCQKITSINVAEQRGKTDDFVKMGGLKLPDFSEYVKVSKANTECRHWCLINCTCLAYAYVSGIGCLVWSRDLIDMRVFPSGGQDLFLRLAHAELGNKQKRAKLIVSLMAVSSATVLIIIAYGFHKWRASQRVNQRDARYILEHHTWRNHLGEQDPSIELPKFDLDSVLVATNNFSAKNKLGQGGYGPVYKGNLKDGKEVAVKRLSSSSGQGTEEFKNEIMLISKLQHRNLVRLIGYCIEREEKILIYEFMPNKSLDTFLFDSTKNERLDWPTRFNIILAIARGMVYLHRDSYLRIIHRDLKVSNILLDEKMNPKISDFGLARIFQGSQVLANTRKVVGTLGYMSPEYAISGVFSEKSDVFSFGVLLLEIISGKKIHSFQYNEHHLGLLAYAWESWSDGRGLSMVDEALGGSFFPSEATKCVNVGLLCVQDHAVDRPNMPAVVSMLSSKTETKLPRPKQPTFSFQTTFDCHVQSQNHCGWSINEVTESVVEGR